MISVFHRSHAFCSPGEETRQFIIKRKARPFETVMSLFLNHFTFNSTDKQDGSGLSRIGATGIFTGLIIGTLAIQIYRLCIKKGWSIKMPNSVPKGVADSFTSLIPGFLIAFVVLIIDAVLIICNTDIFNLLYVPFSFVSGLVDTWWGVLIIVFLIHGLWFFGIHGATIITSFTSAFVLANMASNVAGGFHVYAGEFNNAFTTIGGSGATLGAVLYMAFMSKSHQLRELGKVAVVPGIFNINEPLLFGLPIVYNIDLVIPFVLAPMTSSMVGYFAIATHFVPKNYCPTTMADTGWSERFYRNAKLARRSCNDSRRSCRRSNLVPVHPWL